MSFFMRVLILIVASFFCCIPGFGQTVPWSVPSGEGYYKDVLLNGGPGVDPPPTHHLDMLGLQYEVLSAAECNPDYGLFRAMLIGCLADESSCSDCVPADFDCNLDHNGRLLYPDGAPRFRLLVTGGAASEQFLKPNGTPGGYPYAICELYDPQSTWVHGGGRHYDYLDAIRNRLGSDGVRVIQQFNEGGGSVSGFCAGASLAENLNLQPYRSFAVANRYWDLSVAGGPLSAYLGESFRADNIYTAGGTTIPIQLNSELEILGSESWTNLMWAYKADGQHGRVAVSGAHPEQSLDSDGKLLTAALYTYALAGNGEPRIKATLQNGATRTMNAETTDNNPAFTKIGDKQYHHYRIDVGNERFIKLELQGEPGYDFNLYLNKGAPAFNSVTAAATKVVGPGADKVLIFDNLSAGTWYVAVECASTVVITDPQATNNHPEYNSTYYGALGVLNGVAYSITATWSTSPIECAALYDVAATTHSLRGDNAEVFWRDRCFDNGTRATVSLVAADGAVVDVIASDVLLSGENRITFTANQFAGTYRFKIVADQDPSTSVFSAPWTLTNPSLWVTQPQFDQNDRCTLRWTWNGEAHFTDISLRNHQGSLLWSETVATAPGANELSVQGDPSWGVLSGVVFEFETTHLGVAATHQSPSFNFPYVPVPSGLSVAGLQQQKGTYYVALTGCVTYPSCSKTLTITNTAAAAETFTLHLYLDGQTPPVRPVMGVGDYRLSTRQYAVGPNTYTLYQNQSMEVTLSYYGNSVDPPFAVLAFESEADSIAPMGTQKELLIVPGR